MSIDWKELAKEKPPKPGPYLVLALDDMGIELVAYRDEYKWSEARGEFWFQDGPATHWAYWNSPGEISEDDRRLGELLNNLFGFCESVVYVHGESVIAETLKSRINEEMQIRFGPNWEEVLRDPD